MITHQFTVVMSNTILVTGLTTTAFYGWRTCYRLARRFGN